MLSMTQDEINALLGDSAISDAPPPPEPAPEVEAAPEAGGGPAADNENLTGADAGPDPGASDNLGALDQEVYDTADYLTPEEVDLLGEVGNICMGSVATTVYTLIDRRVTITTPRIHIFTTQDILTSVHTPFIVVDVTYTEGVLGNNLLLLKKRDALIITDLLMGGEGQVDEESELSELHMSAINEIMNQMIGASATALSKMLSIPINISPPNSTYVGVNTDISDMLNAEDLVIKISFDMEVEGLLNSQLLQLMPYDLGRDLAHRLMEVQRAESAKVKEKLAADAEAAAAAASPPPPPAAAPQTAAQSSFPQPQAPPLTGNLVDVRHAQYPSFDEQSAARQAGSQDIGMISDIPLNVSVELGKTKKKINEILEFGVGTIVVLDKIAGEHVEVLVNGKLIAAGEVVVIDENYGVRITDIYNF